MYLVRGRHTCQNLTFWLVGYVCVRACVCVSVVSTSSLFEPRSVGSTKGGHGPKKKLN